MRKIKIVRQAFSDYECQEFHITPVLTYSWAKTDSGKVYGWVIAIEWGFWAAYIGIAHKNP